MKYILEIKDAKNKTIIYVDEAEANTFAKVAAMFADALLHLKN
jgi:hypothetical protein